MTGPITSKPVFLAEYLTDIWVRMIVRNGALAQEAVRRMGEGSYGFDDYLQSLVQFVDGNLSDSIEVAQSVAAGPGFKIASSVVRSVPYPVPDPSAQFQVKLASPLSRGFGDKLPGNQISFESMQGTEWKHCPTGVLATGAEEFCLLVDRTNLQSGSYTAQAEVIPTTEGAGAGVRETVNLTIEL